MTEAGESATKKGILPIDGQQFIVTHKAIPPFPDLPVVREIVPLLRMTDRLPVMAVLHNSGKRKTPMPSRYTSFGSTSATAYSGMIKSQHQYALRTGLLDKKNSCAQVNLAHEFFHFFSA